MSSTGCQLRPVTQKTSGRLDGMIGLLLNGLGVVKYHQDGDTSDRPRRQPWMAAENEFNDRLIMPDTIWCTQQKLLIADYKIISYN